MSHIKIDDESQLQRKSYYAHSSVNANLHEASFKFNRFKGFLNLIGLKEETRNQGLQSFTKGGRAIHQKDESFRRSPKAQSKGNLLCLWKA